MTTNDVIVAIFLMAMAMPIVAYFTVKFGTYGYLRAKDLHNRHRSI